MRKAGVLSILFAVVLFAVAVIAEAQQQAKVPKIGYLSPAPATSSARFELLRREFRKLGYVEGKNIAFEFRSTDNKIDRLPAAADELVRLKVDVLIAPGTPTALAAKNATRTIPIVFAAVADPISAGLIDSLPRPGGNITGFTEISEVLAGKRLELLKETIPNLSRVAVLWNPKEPGNAQQWKESQLPARELGLQLHSMEVSSADKYESAFKEAAKARSGALAVAQDALAGSNLKLIADLSIKNRLPAIYPRGEFVDDGGLMSYGPDPDETSRRVVAIVDKILKGTKPADIPVEQPTKLELAFNLKTAKQIGVIIPQSLLYRADKVIK